MQFKEQIQSPLGIAFSAISLVVISIWSINGFFSWRSYAKFAYEAQRIHPINLSELLNIENEPDKIATFTKIKNCNLVEIEMRNKSKYLLKYGGGSMTEVMNIVGRKGGKGIYKEPNTLFGLPLCFSPTSLQYQIYKSMRDGETAPNPNANNKNNQDNNTNNNWFPNLYQKNINKSIYVVEYADSTGGGVNYGDEALLRRCLKEPQTIGSQKLQELFSLGVKTISAQSWKNDRYYGSLSLNGVCGGQFYVLEGPENLLNKL